MCVSLLAAGAVSGQAPEGGPVATTPHFAFYDDVDTNLNDALIAAGVARNRHRPELFHSGEEAPCFEELPPSARAGWDLAVDYYAKVISPVEFGDRQQYLLRAYLAGYDDRPADDRSRQFVKIAEAFRSAAAPAYRGCRWVAQSAENRRWTAELTPRLASYEEAIADRLQDLYKVRWGDLPIRVDVVETVDWSGANTIIREPGGHILVSRSYEGLQALEIVFHEASHILMARGSPVQEALVDAETVLGVSPPRDLWHVVLFYMTGEAVREVLAASGSPGYEPIVYEIMDRSPRWSSYREALDGAWRPYMDGKTTLTEAATDLVRALPAGGTAPR